MFDYDLTLDQYYFSQVWKDRKKVLKKKELELYTRDCGTKLDLLNLQWIYRAKKYYHMQPADIYSLLVPIHYKLKTEQVKDLVESPSLDEFEVQIQKTYYGKRYQFNGELTDRSSIYTECLHKLYVWTSIAKPIFDRGDQYLPVFEGRRTQKADYCHRVYPLQSYTGETGWPTHGRRKAI